MSTLWLKSSQPLGLGLGLLLPQPPPQSMTLHGISSNVAAFGIVSQSAFPFVLFARYPLASSPVISVSKWLDSYRAGG